MHCGDVRMKINANDNGCQLTFCQNLNVFRTAFGEASISTHNSFYIKKQSGEFAGGCSIAGPINRPIFHRLTCGFFYAALKYPQATQ